MKPTNRQSWTPKSALTECGKGGRSTTATTTAPGRLNAKNRSQVGNESGSFVSVKHYAQHAGVTVQAIYQRMRAGQLGDAVRRNGSRYLINPQRADAAWAMHGKPCNSRAAQLEARLMLLPDQLADELAGMDPTYCRVALTRVILNLLD